MNGIRSGDRIILAKAITLTESGLPEDRALAEDLLDQVIGNTGHSLRIGITGVPGVGKSTFIEAFGKHIAGHQKKLAVLTVDPSSQLTRGSILGDKTRMEELSRNPMAFIRPSASGNVLGGVADHTHEVILLCEAAGFEVILIETVGVGQSEVVVRNMVDFFLLLMLAGAGDELQGIKKGIMEMADAVVITKADGENVKRATEAQAEYSHALHLMPPGNSGWTPPVLTCSALEQKGIGEVWNRILDHERKMKQSGFFGKNRQAQARAWMKAGFEQLLLSDYHRLALVSDTMSALQKDLDENRISPARAARQLLETYHRAIRENRS